MSSPNTLGLDDDMDPVEVAKDLQASFGVRFSNSEAEACRNIGDIYRLLQHHLANREGSGDGCAGAMVFYRLRRALHEIGVESKIGPDTLLAGMTRLPVRLLFKRLQTVSGLRPPSTTLSWMGASAAIMLVICFFALLLSAVLFPDLWVVPIVAGAICIPIIRLDPGRLPSDCRTVGDLAKKFAAKNFGAMVAKGASLREKDVWSAMTEVLSEHSDLPKKQMSFETELLYKR